MQGDIKKPRPTAKHYSIREAHKLHAPVKAKPRKKRGHYLLAVVLALVIAGVVAAYFTLWPKATHDASSKAGAPAQQTIKLVDPMPDTPKTHLKTFTAAEFQKLYESIAYPNTAPIPDPPVITGNPDADARIRQ